MNSRGGEQGWDRNALVINSAMFEHVLDRAALDDPDLIFKRDGGGFARLDKLFNGQLQPVLEAFNDALWVNHPKAA